MIPDPIFYLLRRFTIPAYKIRGIGLGRVCEFIRRVSARLAPNYPLVIHDFYGNGKFFCDLKEHMSSQTFFRGLYCKDSIPIIKYILPYDGIVLDIGANQGEFTVASAIHAQQGTVIAVEPVDAIRRQLLANIRLNELRNVRVVPYALGEHAGEIDLYNHVGNFTDGLLHTGLATFYSTKQRDQLIGRVKVASLDELWPTWNFDRLDLIKIDVEGAEWSVLRGAHGLLQRYRPKLIIEIGRLTCQAAGYEPEAFATWLVGQHYQLFHLGDDGERIPLQPAILQHFQNVLAVPVQ